MLKKNRIGYDLRSDVKKKEETAGDRLKKALTDYRKNPLKQFRPPQFPS